MLTNTDKHHGSVWQSFNSEMGSTNNVSAGDTLGALYFFVSSHPLCQSICIGSVRKKARIISMDNVVNLILIEEQVHELLINLIGDVGDDLVHPLQPPD